MITNRHLKSLMVSATLLAASSYNLPGWARTSDSCVLSAATIAEAKAGIRETLAAYSAALNGGKTSAILPLYTDDAVFMPPYRQSAVGKDAVEKLYEAGFQELRFHLKFMIVELVVMAPTWAYARTNSSGTTDHHSTGKTTSEANHELFIFKKAGGKWRIACYSFSPRNSPTMVHS
jgi:uncharacterized protein (TIGR02246 family)